MAAIRYTDIWKADPTFSRRGPSSGNENDAVDMPSTDEDDEFSMETKDLRLTNVKMQRMIMSAFYIFEEIALDRRNASMGEALLVSLLEAAHYEASKNETTPIQKAAQKHLRLVVTPGDLSKRIHVKVDNHSESNDFVRLLISNHFKNHLSLCVSPTRWTYIR